MSIEQRFNAAVNVIRGLPKNGNYMFSSIYLKISNFIYYLINNPEIKVVFIQTTKKNLKIMKVFGFRFSICITLDFPNIFLFINIKT